MSWERLTVVAYDLWSLNAKLILFRIPRSRPLYVASLDRSNSRTQFSHKYAIRIAQLVPGRD